MDLVLRVSRLLQNPDIGRSRAARDCTREDRRQKTEDQTTNSEPKTTKTGKRYIKREKRSVPLCALKTTQTGTVRYHNNERYVWDGNPNGSDAPSGRVAW